jgi:hypothetical protein
VPSRAAWAAIGGASPEVVACCPKRSAQAAALPVGGDARAAIFWRRLR